MTAEFVVLIPAVCVVLAMSLSGLQLATLQLRIHDAAALAARSAARGEDVVSKAKALIAGAVVHSERRANLLCIRIDAAGPPLAVLLGFSTVSATSCALADGG